MADRYCCRRRRRRRRRCRKGGKKKQEKGKSFVTPAPDFDGYRWRKYGQKQIEGAMYAR
jgi:hypothetical protein